MKGVSSMGAFDVRLSQAEGSYVEWRAAIAGSGLDKAGADREVVWGVDYDLADQVEFWAFGGEFSLRVSFTYHAGESAPRWGAELVRFDRFGDAVTSVFSASRVLEYGPVEVAALLCGDESFRSRVRWSDAGARGSAWVRDLGQALAAL